MELAQLNYLLPRLSGQGVEMSRLGGGIGTRGPGETQLETDRRRIRPAYQEAGGEYRRADAEAHCIARSGTRCRCPRSPGGLHERREIHAVQPAAAAPVLTDARMFATLDPTVRAVELPVAAEDSAERHGGFRTQSAHDSVNAFRATLEEVAEATLILHVVDVSAPHAAAQTGHVLKVLGEIDAAAIPQLLVLNKVDRLPEAGTDVDAYRVRLLGSSGTAAESRAVAISALTGQGIDGLLAAIDTVLPFDPIVRVHLQLPSSDGARIAMLHDLGRVLETRYVGDACELEVEIPESLRRRLSGYIVRP